MYAFEACQKHTVLTQPEAAESLCEFYDMTLDYLQQRYPQYFHVHKPEPIMMYNAIRKEAILKDSKAYKGDMKRLAQTLSHTNEEDFLIMVEDEKSQKYYLRKGSFVFPSGFDPAPKKNLSLSDIHGPVPFYKEKIGKSIDRFSSDLKQGILYYA